MICESLSSPPIGRHIVPYADQSYGSFLEAILPSARRR